MNYTDRLGGIPAREDLIAELNDDLRSTFNSRYFCGHEYAGMCGGCVTITVLDVLRDVLDEERA